MVANALKSLFLQSLILKAALSLTQMWPFPLKNGGKKES